MNSIDKLINIVINFTPEQLERFLSDPVTLSVLRPEVEVEPDRPSSP